MKIPNLKYVESKSILGESTDFEKWYQGYYRDEIDDGNKAFRAWQACKQEILKLLREDSFSTINIVTLDKIQKL